MFLLFYFTNKLRKMLTSGELDKETNIVKKNKKYETYVIKLLIVIRVGLQTK